MALNPFFLQGTSSEQRLAQDLINEQLRMYGVEVTYIPRKFVDTDNILNEVQSSKFDDNFAIEAYVNTYDGYSGQGDIMTKFGISLRDELTLTVSKERFEDFIAPFLAANVGDPDSGITLATRPREGDLIYFPLGTRLFEVKFVEHEDPFYQLGKNYVYQLKCELFEYEDEVIDTSIDIIDTQIQDEGYLSTLRLVGLGQPAEVTSSIGIGYVREIFLNNDGSGFTSQPSITFTESPTGDTARAVGILTTKANVTSIEKILMTSAGAGYNSPPSITISGGGGTGAAATCSIETAYNGVIRFNVISGGVGYGTEPTITVAQPGAGTTAVGIASIGTVGSNSVVRSVYVGNPGRGYASVPSVVVADPPGMSGIGTFIYNEIVQGVRSYAQGRVKSWDSDTDILKLSNVGIGSTVSGFFVGEDVIGRESGATYAVASFNTTDVDDKYNSGDEFQTFGDDILDFTESNPFGQV
tara:strand:+ start:201 stop:1607 length:1407 start_codon:yes stop_codon:yes gene_type:complete